MQICKFYGAVTVGVLLVLSGLACGGQVTPESQPTDTAEAVLPTKKPTKPPKPTATEAAFELNAEAFVHSSGAFTVNLPQDWEVKERDDGVYAHAADGQAALDISFTNVGIEFNEAMFTNYIDAVEANWFSTYTDYAARDPETQADGSLLLAKTISLESDTWMILSYYWHADTVVYEQDFWVLADQYEAYIDSLLAVANSMKTDVDEAAQAPLYTFRYEFTGPEDMFTFEVPCGWTYKHSEDESEAGRLVTDAWTAPDRQSVVESLLYDSGEQISKSAAGWMSLQLLKKFYASDLKITDDKVQSDGSERLTWHSAEKGYGGMTFFEVRGTAFLFQSWYAVDDYADLYQPVWTELVSSYTVP